MLDHFLDIFSKLVIGILSFVAPVTSYLLSTYLSDRELILKRLTIKKNTIDDILKQDIKKNSEKGMDAKAILKSGNIKLRNLEQEIEQNRDTINFLNPKKRIGWLFGLLFTSIGSLMFDALVRSNVFNLYNHKLSVLMLILSCSTFTIAILSLRQIAWKLIEAKEIIIREQRAISEAAKPDIIQQESKEIDDALPGVEVI